MIDIDDLLFDIADFLNDAGCVIPPLALDLIVRSKVAILQLAERVSAERARGNQLQEDADLLREARDEDDMAVEL